MDWVRYLALGFAPAAFWLWFLRRKDRIEPEPRALVLRVFALGCLAPALVLWIRPLLERRLPEDFGTARLLLDAFVVTALVEELVKLAPLAFGIFFHREFDEPLDGIVYGGASALGFASVENVFFLFASHDPWLVFERGFTSMLVHVACTGTLGLLLARARIGRRGRERLGGFQGRDLRLLLAGLLVVVLAHGAYDAFLLSGMRVGRLGILLVIPIVLALFALVLRWAMRDSARRALQS